MQAALYLNVPHSTGLHGLLLGVAPKYDRMQRMQAVCRQYFACSQAYFSEKVQSYFTPRIYLFILGVKYDRIFCHWLMSNWLHVVLCWEGRTLAFGSICHGFESEHRSLSHHSASAFSKLRSPAKCMLTGRFSSLTAVVYSAINQVVVKRG